MSAGVDLADLTGAGANQGASLVGFIQAGTGAVARTVGLKLLDLPPSIADFTSSNFQTAANRGGTIFVPDGVFTPGTVIAGASQSYWDMGHAVDGSGNPLVLPGVQDGWYEGYKHIFQPEAGASDISSMTVHRVASYTGGTTGFLNAGLRILSDVNDTANTYETALFAIQNNYSNGAENFAMGSQANKYGTGPAWSFVTEMHEKSGTANPTSGTTGYELDVFANGTDTSFNRTGLAVISKRENLTGAVATIGYGISISSDSTDTSGSRFGAGIAFGRASIPTDFDIGIDFTNATFSTSGPAVQLAHDQSIAFASGNTKSLKYYQGSSLLRYDAGSGHTFDFFDNGALNITGNLEVLGNVVVSSRVNGWGNPIGTLSRAALDPSTVTLTVLAETVAALITDLRNHHGLIGA